MNAMKYILGIDIGTTNIKAAAFDEGGRMTAYHAVPTPILHPSANMHEFEPEAIWRCVCDCIASVAKAVGGSNVITLGISSMAETGIPVDHLNMPLYNFIAWYDMRSQPQCDRLCEQLGARQIYDITGQMPSGKYGIAKLMWLKQHAPSAYRRMRRWLSMEDYIIYRLTGCIATDYSVAARTMAFDIHAFRWSSTILDAAGIDERIFSPALPGGAFVGKMTRKACEACGLGGGVSVSIGGHDHACAAIAVNILESGIVLDSMGTGEVTMVAVEKPVNTQACFQSFYSIYPHCGKKIYRMLTSNQACGVAIEWFLKVFCQDLIERAKHTGESKYDLLFSAMRMGKQRHEGLFFLPLIRGTVEQPDMYGSFCGIADVHDRGDFVAAMVDGLLFEVKRQVEGYAQLFAKPFDKIRVVGGISKSAPMMQRKADVHDCAVQVPEVTEAACMGAAILGALGGSVFSFSDLADLYRSGKAYLPDAGLAREDRRRFERYEGLRKAALAANGIWNRRE